MSGDTDGGLLTTNDLPFFSLWSSTNLADWELLPDTGSLSNGVLWLSDSSATNSPQRFYRVSERP